MYQNLLLITVLLLFVACGPRVEVGTIETASPLNGDTLQLSATAENYIDEVVAVMERDALYKENIDFGKVRQTIREAAAGAQTVEDTHEAISRALPLLKDHHSSFFPVSTLKSDWGWTDADIQSIKQGKPPSIGEGNVAGLADQLTFAQGKFLRDSIGYLSIPPFSSVYLESMQQFADSLQLRIKAIDAEGPKGWIIDLRDNYGGNAMPMITGLGPLLDAENRFSGLDVTGQVRTASFYRSGYYDVEDQHAPVLLLETGVGYTVKDTLAPVIILTSNRTASSAEAVVAIFKGQKNVTVLGTRTNGLTTVNSFEFLSDNSVLNLTLAHYADRDGEVYIQGIDPDVAVNSATEGNGDPTLEAAIRRIR